jgi:DNA-binding NtrC family response regulator
MTDLPHSSILLIEDEPVLAMDVEACLTAAGYRVVGPAANTADAFRLIADQQLDLVILDLNLGTEMAYAVPDFLADREIPFIILTGHSSTMVAERHRKRPFLQKPYMAANLLRSIRETLNDINGRRPLKQA